MQLQLEAITNANAADVVVRVEEAIRAGDRRIDFSGVVRCDTAAVACILAWMRAARAAGGEPLTFVALPEDLRSLAQLYNVEPLLGPSSR